MSLHKYFYDLLNCLSAPIKCFLQFIKNYQIATIWINVNPNNLICNTNFCGGAKYYREPLWIFPEILKMFKSLNKIPKVLLGLIEKGKCKTIKIWPWGPPGSLSPSPSPSGSEESTRGLPNRRRRPILPRCRPSPPIKLGYDSGHPRPRRSYHHTQGEATVLPDIPVALFPSPSSFKRRSSPSLRRGSPSVSSLRWP